MERLPSQSMRAHVRCHRDDLEIFSLTLAILALVASCDFKSEGLFNLVLPKTK